MPTCRILLPVLLIGLAGSTAPAPAESPVQVTPGRYTLDEFLPETRVPRVIDRGRAMRQLLARIADAARRLSPDLILIAEGGLELFGRSGPLSAADPDGEGAQVLDGLFVPNLFFSADRPDLPIPGHAREDRVALARDAAANGLSVFAVEAVHGRQSGTARQLAAAAGLIAVTGPPLQANGAAPPRPPGETAGPVATLADVRTVLRISADTETVRIVASAAGSNADLIVVPPFCRSGLIAAADVARLKYKRTGARRLVLARIDVTGAAPGRWYWQAGWDAGSPAWLGPADRSGRHPVQFWDPAWFAIIAGPGRSYLAGLVALGYDGVVLAGIDDYQRIESR